MLNSPWKLLCVDFSNKFYSRDYIKQNVIYFQADSSVNGGFDFSPEQPPLDKPPHPQGSPKPRRSTKPDLPPPALKVPFDEKKVLFIDLC